MMVEPVGDGPAAATPTPDARAMRRDPRNDGAGIPHVPFSHDRTRLPVPTLRRRRGPRPRSTGNLADLMRKSWPFALAVIAVGGLAGVAIAGRPDSQRPVRARPLHHASRSITDADRPRSRRPRRRRSRQPRSDDHERADHHDRWPTRSPRRPRPRSLRPRRSCGNHDDDRRSVAARPGPLVIVNGDGRFRLASITADRVWPLGYEIVLGDTLQRVDVDHIYYRARVRRRGCDRRQRHPRARCDHRRVSRLTRRPISNADDRGDVLIVLGPDARVDLLDQTPPVGWRIL